MSQVASNGSSGSPVRIAGTGSYLPEKILTNEDLEKLVETSDEWITSRTGIKQRRVAAEGELTSHMAAKAGEKALEQAGIDGADVELIIVSTITPDTLTPATACYVQQHIGALKSVAFDVSAACSGFLYALEIARHSIGSGAFNNALIIGAEKLSAFVNWTDRNTCVLFGDGAGAAVLTRSENGDGRILSSRLGTDGAQAELLNIPGGGSACPITPENADQNLASLAMQGREVFKHAVNAMKRAAEDAIESAGLTAADIKLVIPHQANIRIIDAIVDRLEVPSENVFINVDKYGNTSAAAVAIALDEAHRQGRIEKGDKVLLVAFGAGLTWASAVVEW
ncbi:MAG: ketoacyl-ACP synthase III [Verrucomicrobiales bacterium]|nr:ketoacyl-ACP synthase III [Verrucomicrobiales bacterium]